VCLLVTTTTLVSTLMMPAMMSLADLARAMLMVMKGITLNATETHCTADTKCSSVYMLVLHVHTCAHCAAECQVLQKHT
jgi:hypothetical protein